MADSNFTWMDKFFEGTGEKKNSIMNIEVDMLMPWHTGDGHPFDVEEDDDMLDLMAKIERDGILQPILVRREENLEGRFEIISGHRRVYCAKKLSIPAVPAICVDYDDEKATIAMVEANVGLREHIKPSNLAKAYKMYMDANMKKVGRKAGNNAGEIEDDDNLRSIEGTGKKNEDTECPNLSTTEEAAIKFKRGTSTIKLYIRLTKLIPELMQLIDDGKLPIKAGAELSYLVMGKQLAINEKIQMGYKVNQEEANRLRKLTDDEFREEMQRLQAELTTPKVIKEKKPKLNERYVNTYLPVEIRKKPVELKQQYVQKALVMYNCYLKEHPEEMAEWEM